MSLTRRQQLIQRLSEGPATVRGLATELGVPLRLVVEDLEHVRRSLRDRKLVVEPARCNDCGLVFTKRERFTAPSRCPVCRSESTSEPELRIE
jgi:predicted Zn-ribbon and HTH transcriptional regulator